MKKEKLFMIFDINAPLLEDYPEIRATNARKALQKYLDSKKIKIRFKRSGARDCEYKTTPFCYENGKKYRSGEDCWFKIIN